MTFDVLLLLLRRHQATLDSKSLRYRPYVVGGQAAVEAVLGKTREQSYMCTPFPTVAVLQLLGRGVWGHALMM